MAEKQPKKVQKRLEDWVSGRLHDLGSGDTTRAPEGSEALPQGDATRHPVVCEHSVAYTIGPRGNITSLHSGGLLPDTLDKPFEPGHVFGEKWRLVEGSSAEGAFGYFYRGEHRVLKMKVGVKVLRRCFTATAEGRKLFHQEAMHVSLLHHPNIVKIFDYGEDEDTPYLVMELLSGQPLTTFIAAGGLSVDDSVEIVGHVAQALVYAHGSSETRSPLVHLDLKPDHVFVEKIGERWHVKVIDFGIAQIVAPASTHEGGDAEEANDEIVLGIAGTPSYMGPERFRGEVRRRSDLYALGVILYELLAGQKPFQDRDLNELRKLHETATPPPPSDWRIKQPSKSLRALDKLALGLLAKEVEDRPSAEEFLLSLEKWQETRQQDLRGFPWKRYGLVAAVALVLATLGLWWGPWRRVVVPRKVPVIGLVAPEPAEIFLSGLLSGRLYQGAKVFLKIDGSEGLIALAVEHGQEQDASGEWNHQIKVAWPEASAILEATGRIDENFEVRARLLVRRDFQRTLRSKFFSLLIDRTRPKIIRFRNAKFDERNTLLVRESDLPSLTYEARIGPGDSIATDSISFPPDAESFEEDVTDRAGNVTRYKFVIVDRSFVSSDFDPEVESDESSKIIRWRLLTRPTFVVKSSRLLDPDAERNFFTHQSQELVHFDIDDGGDPKHSVEIWIDGDPPRRFFKDQFSIPIDFDGDSAAGQKTLRLRLEPEADSIEWTVQFLRREFEIDVKTADTLRGSPVVMFYSDGNPLDLAAFASLGIEYSLHCFEGDEKVECEIGADGEIKVDPAVRGQLHLAIKVEDKYGNQYEKLVQDFLYPAPPRIEHFRFTGPGGEERPFYWAEDESLGVPMPDDKVFRFDANITYAFPEDLEKKLHINDLLFNEADFDSEPGKIRVVEADLINILGPGSNDCKLVVADPAHEDLKHEFPLSLVFHQAEIIVEPQDGKIRDGKVSLRISIRGFLPKYVTVNTKCVAVNIKYVTVNTKRYDERKKEYTHDVVVSLHGKSEVSVLVRGPEGEEYSISREFTHLPEEGKRYGFQMELPGLSKDLVLRYSRGDRRYGAFWYTDFSNGAVSMTKVLSRIEKWSARFSASREADHLETPLIRLPDLIALQLISAQRDFGVEHFEWIADAPDNPDYYDASCAKIDARGIIVKFNAEKVDKRPYRLLFRADLFNPANSFDPDKRTQARTE